MPDVVAHGTTGLLAPMDDAGAVADHAVALLQDRERAAAMGRAGRARVVATYSADRLVADIEALYTRLLDDRR